MPGNKHKSQTKIGNTLLSYTSYVIALGGFLFGYDTGVINGALSFLSKKDQFDLSSSAQGVVSSALVLGCAFGAFYSGRLANKLGRRQLLQLVALIFTLSTLGACLSVNPSMLVIFRFILGLSVGCASSLAPLYLNEISPNPLKSLNVNKNSIAIVVGQLSAFTFNAILGSIWGDWHPIWRIMMMMAALPALILWILSFDLPNSPFWHIFQGAHRRALATFHYLGFPKLDIKKDLQIAQRQRKESHRKLNWKSLLKNRYVLYLLISGLSIGLIQQIAGINTVMYYGTVVLQDVGMGQGASLYGNVFIGLISSLAVAIGNRLTVKYVHQHLLLIGLIADAIILGLLSFTMKMTFLPQVMINIFILFFLAIFLATEQGLVSPVTWLLISEIFPPKIKPTFMGLSTSTSWITNFLVSLIFPILIGLLGTANAFLFFVLTNIISAFLAYIFVKPKILKRAFQKLTN